MPIIEVKNLIKKFKNFTAVDEISFSVDEGEIFAFLGPNGAGKSTTIKMLTTLLHPTSGELRINGFDPIHQQNDARKAFGIVFQDQSLDDELTAMENMQIHAALYSVPKKLAEARIFELLSIVELWDRRDSLAKTFSGGMKRRLEIARGLLHHPKIFFLDEPTVGLDPQTRNQIWEYIQALNKKEGITIFFTTHYMEEAEKVAGRIGIIDHGKMIAEGTAQSLREQTGSTSLEDAFLALTGKTIRNEAAGAIEALRAQRKMFKR